MHLHHPTHALLLALDRVDYRVTGRQHTGINTSKGQGTHERVGSDLERQSGERLVITCMTLVDLLFVIRIDALNRGNLGRRRQIVDDSIENQGHALVLEGRTTNGRNDFTGDGALTQTSLDLFDGQLTTFEILVHQLFVGLGRSLDHVRAIFFGQIHQLRRNLFLAVGGALVVIVPVDGLHLDQIDLTGEVLFGTNGQLNRNRGVTQALLDLTDDAQEVGTLTVHLVDVDDTRHAVLVGLTPYGFGLRLNAGGTAEHNDSTVENAQGALYFDGEVNVTGGIDDVYTIVVVLTARTLPKGRDSSGGDGDTTLLLLHHPVGGRRTVMHFTHLVAEAGVKQNPLRGGSLARVDVGTDTDVTVAVDRGSTGHNKVLVKVALDLEAVVREGLVGFSHTVHVFALLDRSAFTFKSIQQLASEAQRHGFFATLARSIYQPAHGQRVTTGRTNFDRNLVGSTAYTAGLDFDQRSDGIECFFEDFQGVAILALLHLVQGTINDTLGNGLLAAFHHVVHELGQDQTSVLRIVQNLALGCYTTSWH